tara:strand:- start:308 stop:448 length:141 start_codon:yes stop_codon:yes gene_type:complete
MSRVYEFLLILLVGGFVYLAIDSAINKMIPDDPYKSNENNLSIISQ